MFVQYIRRQRFFKALVVRWPQTRPRGKLRVLLYFLSLIEFTRMDFLELSAILTL